MQCISTCCVLSRLLGAGRKTPDFSHNFVLSFIVCTRQWTGSAEQSIGFGGTYSHYGHFHNAMGKLLGPGKFFYDLTNYPQLGIILAACLAIILYTRT